MNRRFGAWILTGTMAVSSAGTVRADQTFLREADAPHVMFPESTGAERRTLELTDAELKWLERTLSRRTDVTKYPYFEVSKQHEPLGRIFILDVVGQAHPITFAVAVGLDGLVKDVEVLVYREPYGAQIEEARFRRQFTGKKLTDPITLGRDVDVITGATISSRAATYAVRKGLSLAEVLRARSAGP